MIYLWVVIFSIVCCMGGMCLSEKESYLGQVCVLSVVKFFMIYVVVSGFLFWTNFFSINKAVFLTWMSCFLSFLMEIRKNGIYGINLRCGMKHSYLPAFSILALVLFNSGHYEFYGMGQDQGVYQTEAINLYYDVPMHGDGISEYEELPEGEYKEYYEYSVSGLGGYYLREQSLDFLGVKEEKINNDLDGEWHGIPTYPAILALFAKMFGISNMHITGTIFLICLLCIVDFIMVSFGISQMIRALCIILLGLSPIVMWVKKSTLTEGFLAVLIITYLYYLISAKDKDQIKSSYPIIVFSYFHVTIYTMLPIFLVNYWLLYFKTGNRQFLKCAKFIIIGYITGFAMMCCSGIRYTLGNYKSGLFFLSYDQIPLFVFVASAMAFSLTILFEKKDIKISICERRYKFLTGWLCLFVIFIILGYAMTKKYDFHGYIMLTLSCYTILSGVVLMPILIIKFLRKKYEMNNRLMVISNMFLWSIIIYSAIMRRDIPYYYYYARYLMPYISIILILFVIMVNHCKKQVICLIIGNLLLFPYSNVLRVNADDSRMEWSVLEEILENLKDASTIILDIDAKSESLTRLLYFPLKAATNAKIYPLRGTLEETLKVIPDEDQVNCFYISIKDEEIVNSWLNVIYRNCSSYEETDWKYEEDVNCQGTNLSGWSGLPTDISIEGSYMLSVYKIKEKESVIDSKSEDNFSFGWAEVNTSGYRWTNGQVSMVQCYLDKDDYTVEIGNGDMIPFDIISCDKIGVNIYMNQVYVGKIEYTQDNPKEKQRIDISEKIVLDGANELCFVMDDNWSPAEFGSEDKRNYGFSVSYIKFLKKER